MNIAKLRDVSPMYHFTCPVCFQVTYINFWTVQAAKKDGKDHLTEESLCHCSGCMSKTVFDISEVESVLK